MKRYLLFSGLAYYPGGGWRDYRGSFDTIPDAEIVALKRDDDWYHIVDTTTQTECRGKGGWD